MKKTTELKTRIAIRWALSMLEWMATSILVTLIMMHFGASLGWILIMPVLIGMILVAPLLCRNDEIIHHYEKILRRKEGK